MGIADFYLTLENFEQCAHALGAAEFVLKDKLLKYITTEVEVRDSDGSSAVESSSSDSSGTHFITSERIAVLDIQDSVLDIEGDLNRRWLRLDLANLRRAAGN